MVQIGCCLHTCLDNIKGGMKRNNSLSVSLTENMITCRLSFTMQQDAKKAIAMSSLVLYLTCLFMNVKSKKTKKGCQHHQAMELINVVHKL